MSGCIESHLKPQPNGYCLKLVGSRSDGTRRKVGHHRLTYAEHHGFDVDGPEMADLDVCHACDNRSCINIDHLFLGTRSDNMQDMARKGRRHDTRGVGNGHAKLTEFAVRWIRSLYLSGYTQKELAVMFDAGTPAISNIVNRKSWGHI